jgi:hypothetical protein
MIKILLLLASVAHAGPYYTNPVISTSAGTAYQSISGVFGVAQSSKTPDTYIIKLDGPSGKVSASTFAGSGVLLTNIPSTAAVTAAAASAAAGVEASSLARDLLIGGATEQLHLSILAGGASTQTLRLYVDALFDAVAVATTTENSRAVTRENAIGTATGTEKTDRLLGDSLLGGATHALDLAKLNLTGGTIAGSLNITGTLFSNAYTPYNSGADTTFGGHTDSYMTVYFKGNRVLAYAPANAAFIKMASPQPGPGGGGNITITPGQANGYDAGNVTIDLATGYGTGRFIVSGGPIEGDGSKLTGVTSTDTWQAADNLRELAGVAASSVTTHNAAVAHANGIAGTASNITGNLSIAQIDLSTVPTSAQVDAKLDKTATAVMAGAFDHNPADVPSGKYVVGQSSAGAFKYSPLDTTPTSGSTSPATSGGIYTALGTKQSSFVGISSKCANGQYMSSGTWVNGVLTGGGCVVAGTGGGGETNTYTSTKTFTDSVQALRVFATTGAYVDGSNTNKIVLRSSATQSTLSADHSNLSILGYASGGDGDWGYAAAIMGVGDAYRSYHAIGVHAALGSGAYDFCPDIDSALYANAQGYGWAGYFTGGGIYSNGGIMTDGDLNVNATTYLVVGASTATWTPGYCISVDTVVVSDAMWANRTATYTASATYVPFATVEIPAGYFNRYGMGVEVTCSCYGGASADGACLSKFGADVIQESGTAVDNKGIVNQTTYVYMGHKRWKYSGFYCDGTFDCTGITQKTYGPFSQEDETTNINVSCGGSVSAGIMNFEYMRLCFK